MKINEWSIAEDVLDANKNELRETTFSLGNGYLGLRGNFEESYNGILKNSMNGTYINGFYEKNPIQYGEIAYGYAVSNEAMLNVTNGRSIELFIDNERFNMFSGTIVSYKRELNMKRATLERIVNWISPKGHEVLIEIERCVSFEIKNLMTIKYKVTPLNFSGDIMIISSIDGDVKNIETSRDPRVGSDINAKSLKVKEIVAEDNFQALIQEANNSKLSLICAMKNEIVCDAEVKNDLLVEKEQISMKYSLFLKENNSVSLYKYVSYFTSKDCTKYEFAKKAKKCLEMVTGFGYANIITKQIKYMNKFWSDADIKVEGDMLIQQGIRFNEFHLLQSVGKDGLTSIPAKGLTGEGYGGHYFWDADIFVLPFFLYVKPEIARKLLEYRYSLLPSARDRARVMSFKKGALFAWRTISGEECSAYYPAGTAQYHINADIAYAVKNYFETTNDMEFLKNYGAEILFETARIWTQLGCYDNKNPDRFCINCVTGPDEYTAIVNNNCYTNAMARENLYFAYKTAKVIQIDDNERYKVLIKKINLEDDEIEEWQKAANSMYIPYDNQLQIHMQDDSFLNKAIWDFKNTKKEKYPLLLHYHPLVIYRYQVCKQADVVLMEFLLSKYFNKEDKKSDFNYYEAITTHDSSLSTCIYSIMASEIGYREKAYKYFLDTGRMDLDNNHNNSQYGIHTACMGGTYMSIINGFAGMRMQEGRLYFKPYLPDKWKSYEFKIKVLECNLSILVTPNFTQYTLIYGHKLNFYHNDEIITLDSNNISIIKK